MIGNLARIPEHVRASLHEDPERINALLYPDAAEDEPNLSSAIAPISSEDAIDIDKTWHAVHFLFTGSDWEGDFPEGILVSCGEPVGDVDVGYGPARSFSSTEVKRISAFLMSLDSNGLLSRFDPVKMAELKIYPSIWKDSKHPDEDRTYIEDGVSSVIAFVTEAAQKDLALLVYIS